ncbi:unnamed protein product [Leuciscus chuanchicus]
MFVCLRVCLREYMHMYTDPPAGQCIVLFIARNSNIYSHSESERTVKPVTGELEEQILEEEGQRPSAATAEMLRYLIKTLLQMNLFTDTIRDATNGTDLFFNISSIPSFNSSLLEWANFTGLNVSVCVCVREREREFGSYMIKTNTPPSFSPNTANTAVILSTKHTQTHTAQLWAAPLHLLTDMN